MSVKPRLRLSLERPPNSTEPTPCLKGASKDQKNGKFFGYEPARVASALKTCKNRVKKGWDFRHEGKGGIFTDMDALSSS